MVHLILLECNIHEGKNIFLQVPCCIPSTWRVPGRELMLPEYLMILLTEYNWPCRAPPGREVLIGVLLSKFTKTLIVYFSFLSS